MKYTFSHGCLTVYPKGRLSAKESDDFLKEIIGLLDRYNCESVVIDMSGLEYLTSPCLHALLLLKRRISNITLSNVQPANKEIITTAGLSGLLKITDGFRSVSIKGCRIIGVGVKGTVYQYSPDTAVKVFRSSESLSNILRERDLACCALVHGLPTAISFDVVKVGSQYGAMFELIDAESMSHEMKKYPEKKEEYAKIFAKLLLDVHRTEVHKDYTVPDIKPLVRQWLDKSGTVLSASEAQRIYDIIEAVPDRNTMIHGDYHTNNIMMQRGEPYMIDMGTLSHGHPVFELANIYTAYVGFGEYDRSMAENFLGLPYDFCISFWDIFFSYYTKGMSEPEKDGLLKLARLLGCIRYLHHILRRDDISSDAGAVISGLHNTVSELLPKISAF